MHAIVQLLFTPSGRIPRRRFWFGVLLVFVASVVLSLIAFALGLGTSTTLTGTTQLSDGTSNSFSKTSWVLNPWAQFVISTLGTIPMTILAIKRRHDRDGNGWDVVAFAVMSILVSLSAAAGLFKEGLAVPSLALLVWGLVLFILVGCLRGTPATNGYGPDPLAAAAPPPTPPAT